MVMQNSEQNLAILVSGGGSTAQRICQAYKAGELVGIRPRLVISSRDDVTVTFLVLLIAFFVKLWLVNPQFF